MADNPIAELIRAILDNLTRTPADGAQWEAMSMLLEFPDSRFQEVHGYLYLPDGVVAAVSAVPRAVLPAVQKYTESLYGPGERLPRTILLQFDRASGKYDVSFEETDEDRWKVTPQNFRALREELRPAL